MEGEILNFVMVWLSVFISLIYCYSIRNFVPEGSPRLLFVLPVVCLFLLLPLSLSSAHLGGLTAFFIAWLANFKLLLFAFGKGPLSSDPSISLPLFVTLACLPIKIQQDHSPRKSKQKQNPLNYTVKALLLGILIRAYDYSDHFHPKLLSLLYAAHIYFALEIILAIVAALVQSVLGLELEPQFNEPYLSTSLQDFWGRRWNLMVTRILRPTVYEPTLHVSTRVIGRNLAPLPAVFATFVVSALMHELIFFYLGRARPTGECTCFFLLHGFCLTAEIAAKKALKGRWSPPTIISRTLTVGFFTTMALWLFFPEFVRCGIDVKAFEEYAAVGAWMKDFNNKIIGALTGR